MCCVCVVRIIIHWIILSYSVLQRSAGQNPQEWGSVLWRWVCGSGVCCVCEYLHVLYAEYFLRFEGQ